MFLILDVGKGEEDGDGLVDVVSVLTELALSQRGKMLDATNALRAQAGEQPITIFDFKCDEVMVSLDGHPRVVEFGDSLNDAVRGMMQQLNKCEVALKKAQAAKATLSIEAAEAHKSAQAMGAVFDYSRMQWLFPYYTHRLKTGEGKPEMLLLRDWIAKHKEAAALLVTPHVGSWWKYPDGGYIHILNRWFCPGEKTFRWDYEGLNGECETVFQVSGASLQGLDDALQGAKLLSFDELNAVQSKRNALVAEWGVTDALPGDWFRLEGGQLLNVTGREHYEVDGRVLWSWDIFDDSGVRFLGTSNLCERRKLLDTLKDAKQLNNHEAAKVVRTRRKTRREADEAAESKSEAKRKALRADCLGTAAFAAGHYAGLEDAAGARGNEPERRSHAEKAAFYRELQDRIKADL